MKEEGTAPRKGSSKASAHRHAARPSQPAQDIFATDAAAPEAEAGSAPRKSGAKASGKRRDRADAPRKASSKSGSSRKSRVGAKGKRGAKGRKRSSKRGRKKSPLRRFKRFCARNRALCWVAGGALLLVLALVCILVLRPRQAADVMASSGESGLFEDFSSDEGDFFGEEVSAEDGEALGADALFADAALDDSGAEEPDAASLYDASAGEDAEALAADALADDSPGAEALDAEPPAEETAEPEDAAEPEEAAEPEDAAEPAVDGTPIPTAAPNPMLAFYPTEFSVLKGKYQTDHPLGLPESEKVDDSFFNSTVFVGDSISLKLRNYVQQMRKKYPKLLGNAKFLTIGSLGSYELLRKVSSESLHPVVKGKKMKLEDALYKMQAKKLYIMLGMNDASHSGVKKAVNDLITVLLNVRAKMPDLEIYVQSATPRLSGVKPTTGMLFDYDIELYQRLSSLLLKDVYFVDVGYIMRDDRGFLPKSYCSDPDGMAMHFTDVACRKWVEFLYTHTVPEA